MADPFEKWATRQHEPGDDEQQHPQDGRSPFERDRDRIIHSGAFRRLQGKTQVFGVGDADFYRTRLTHSLECAQIGRALAMRFFPGDHRFWELVESACLAHDLGHPPFGHNGEEELAEQLGPLGFEGNAQTLRLLTRLEVRSDGYPGLNLTRGTLASVIKYPSRQGGGRKKYIYEDDGELVERWILADAPAGLRPFPCELMDFADDVAYSTHDVEDGIRARFITPLELRDARVRAQVAILAAEALSPGGRGVSIDTSDVAEVFGELLARLEPDTAYQPGAARRRVARHLISTMMNEVKAVPSGEAEGDPLWGWKLVVPHDVRRRCEVLKQLSRICVMQDSRVTTIRHKGREIVRRLFDALKENALTPGRGRYELFPLHRRSMLAGAPSDAAQLRMVADYVAGMTDSFAMRMFARLFYPQQGTLFDIV